MIIACLFIPDDFIRDGIISFLEQAILFHASFMQAARVLLTQSFVKAA